MELLTEIVPLEPSSQQKFLTWRMLKFVRWEDDAIIYNNLRMRDNGIDLDEGQVRLYENHWTDFHEICYRRLPCASNPKSHFLSSYSC
jgi:hypothetical protein